MLLECKQGRTVATLETAIFLLRQVLEQRNSFNTFQLGKAVASVSVALLARFTQWGWFEDIEELVKWVAMQCDQTYVCQFSNFIILTLREASLEQCLKSAM